MTGAGEYRQRITLQQPSPTVDATGDQVITGPYNSVRNIADGDQVKVDNKQDKK